MWLLSGKIYCGGIEMTKVIYIHSFDDKTKESAANVRISLGVYQFMASGVKECGRTDSDGKLTIHLDIDEGGDIMIYANGGEASKRFCPENGGNYSVYI
jgi:hypothetical protein